MLEASALEDEEQYLQVAELLKLFSIRNAKNQNLIRRAQDFGINGKLSAAPSAVEVVIRDSNLTKDEVAVYIAAGVASVTVVAPSQFEDLVPPFDIRIGEGTARVEDIQVSSVDLGAATGHLSFSAPSINEHFVGDTVSYVSGDPDIIVASGTIVRRPATSTTGDIDFVMQEAAIIANGNYASNSSPSIAVAPGRSSRVGANQLVSFADGVPFPGAEVINTNPSTGGADPETDQQFRDRIVRSQQFKTAATRASIESNLSGVINQNTGQQITTVKVREDFIDNLVTVFIDDGTGISPDREAFAVSNLSADVSAGEGTIPVVSALDFPSSGIILINEEAAFRYTGKTGNTLIIDSDAHPGGSIGSSSFTSGDTVKLVEMAEATTETGQVDFFSKLFPIEDGTMEVFTALIDDGGGGSFGWLGANEIEATEFSLNRGSGQVQIGTPVVGGFTVFLHYSYFSGIMGTAQTILNGDPNDLLNVPGVRAQGVRMVVDTPTVVNITVKMSITAQEGFNELDLRPQVQSAVVDYINGLSVNDDVIVSELVAVSQEVDGVLDTVVITPTSNVTIAEDELARTDVDEVLVT
jgi:uncharacterized phage protein gp47/JayE